jgi:hypothetical protein
MPSFMFGAYLNNVVAVHFPGGRLGWAKAGCEAVLIQVPGEKDIVYIHTPIATTKDLDLAAFRNAVDTHANSKRMRVRWVADDNIPVTDPAKAKLLAIPLMIIVAACDPQATVLFRRGVMVVGYHGDKEGAEMLLVAIEASKFVRRVVVVMAVGCIERSWDIPDITDEGDASPEQVMEASPNKERAINAGDIADIASLLEHSGDVNDFINKI